jgi:hypothetical protein
MSYSKITKSQSCSFMNLYEASSEDTNSSSPNYPPQTHRVNINIEIRIQNESDNTTFNMNLNSFCFKDYTILSFGVNCIFYVSKVHIQ